MTHRRTHKTSHAAHALCTALSLVPDGLDGEAPQDSHPPRHHDEWTHRIAQLGEHVLHELGDAVPESRPPLPKLGGSIRHAGGVRRNPPTVRSLSAQGTQQARHVCTFVGLFRFASCLFCLFPLLRCPSMHAYWCAFAMFMCSCVRCFRVRDVCPVCLWARLLVPPTHLQRASPHAGHGAWKVVGWAPGSVLSRCAIEGCVEAVPTVHGVSAAGDSYARACSCVTCL